MIPVEVGGVFAFIGHMVFAEQAAESIEWSARNPFQTEMVMANLATGTLGILCYWIRSNFWVATVIANAVFLLGAAMVHIQQILVAHDYSTNNVGVILYTDIFAPLILTLLTYYGYAGKHEARWLVRSSLRSNLDS